MARSESLSSTRRTGNEVVEGKEIRILGLRTQEEGGRRKE
jgi:hypothetical protein